MSDEMQEGSEFLLGAVAAPPRNTVLEDVDTLTDAAETCAFVRRVVDRHVLAEPRRREHIAKLEAIERRMNDPNLYLGVIGEFSSGKSTFINGLLRTRLLKAACIATTASTTRIRRGPVFSVRARFDDGVEVLGTEDDKSALAAAVLSRQPELAADASLTTLLEHLTSDPVVAGSVQDVDVRFPSEHLSEDLVILDTPGIGAGASIAESHGSVTQRAMKEVIDCAIVLIPSANAMTNTLLDFLETYARPFLHRCLFVITAMDRQDDAARAEIRAFVREKLAESLGLSDPWVLESAAIAMLPLATVPESLRESREYWRAEFESLESAVRSALERKRTLIIAESLVRLLSEVFDALNGDLLLRRDALAEEERQLQESSVEKIETLLAALRQRSEAEIRRRESSLRVQAAAMKETHRAAAAEWIHGLVGRTGNGPAEPPLATAIEESLKHYGRTFVDSINGELDRLRTICESASAEFSREFEASYRGLKALGVNVAVPPLAIAPVPDPALFRSGVELAAKHVSLEKEREAGCAMLGGFASAPLGCIMAPLMAMVGCGIDFNVHELDAAAMRFILGGLVGLVIPALMGAKLGKILSDLGGPQRRAERERLLRLQIDPGIQEFFDRLERDLDAFVRGTVDGVLKEFDAAAAQHITTYGGAVERFRQEHEQNRRSLDSAIAQTSVDIEELTWRRRRLDVLRQRLSTPAVATMGGAQ